MHTSNGTDMGGSAGDHPDTCCAHTPHPRGGAAAWCDPRLTSPGLKSVDSLNTGCTMSSGE